MKIRIEHTEGSRSFVEEKIFSIDRSISDEEVRALMVTIMNQAVSTMVDVPRSTL